MAFLIHGIKESLLLSENIFEKCINCKKQNVVKLNIFQKYYHFFWIPLFPIKKSGKSDCSHCKQVLKQDEFRDALKDTYDRLKTQYKAPGWMFIGSILFIILILCGVYNYSARKEKVSQLILSPQTNDVYKVSNGYKKYTLYKVYSAAGDKVTFLTLDYEVKKRSKLDDIDTGNSSFSGDTLVVQKQELVEMTGSGKIMDIIRK